MVGVNSSDFVVKYISHWHSFGTSLFIQMEFYELNMQQVIDLLNTALPLTTNAPKAIIYNKIRYFISTELVVELIQGLHFLHTGTDNIVVHRDLKPEVIIT